MDSKEILQKSDALYARLTSDMRKDVNSAEIQSIVSEIIRFIQEVSTSSSLENDYWNMIIESYSNDLIKAVNDKKYGAGASEYMAEAFLYYFENSSSGKK